MKEEKMSDSPVQAGSSPLLPQWKDVENHLKDGKVVIQFRQAGSAPEMKQNKFKLKADATFSSIVDFLRKQIKYTEEKPLFLFVNRTFQPTPDAIVSDLFRCFHTDAKFLVVYYCETAAWG
uniref:Ubiquitin-like protein ATG12 n=1 Tax=Arcella intermedia TaxID=1963864 RepID=A0A6B2LSK4_9EUKA